MAGNKCGASNISGGRHALEFEFKKMVHSTRRRGHAKINNVSDRINRIVRMQGKRERVKRRG